MNHSLFPDRMTTKQAADVLGLSPDTLAIWRCTKRYPLPYIKIGRKVFYRGQDIQAFIEKRTVQVEEVQW